MRVRNLCSKMAAAGPQAPIAIFFTQKLPQGNFHVSPFRRLCRGKENAVCGRLQGNSFSVAYNVFFRGTQPLTPYDFFSQNFQARQGPHLASSVL